MKFNITETVLRDAQQSLLATRLPFDSFALILKDLDLAGYSSLECWGGATFDSCLRYLHENPWERLRKIKKICKNTPLQMLLRGQNILGYKHYPDEIVRKFIKLSAYNGIDIFRIFDALNDFRNISTAVDEVKKQGCHAQGTIVYTISPIHNIDTYVNLGIKLENMGVDSICIKDMAGLLSPEKAYDLVKQLKSKITIPLYLHCHCTNGLAEMSYLKAIEAGIDGIDTAISSFSSGTSQPATESMNFALNSMGIDTGLDFKKLKLINDFFKPLRSKFFNEGLINQKVLTPQPEALIYQIPGGMLSNMISQLKNQNSLDKLDDVLMEVPEVRKDLGYPPLVTPMSQMVGTQATLNVLTKERYKLILKEVKSYCEGHYGKAPGSINPELLKKALGNKKIITSRFAETLSPIFEQTKNKLLDLTSNDEDVLSYILFPQIAEDFIKSRNNSPTSQYIRDAFNGEVV